MTKAQFLRFKKRIEQLEAAALTDGIDIASVEFENIIKDQLKQRGFTSEDFEEAEEKFSDPEKSKSGLSESDLTEIRAFKGPRGDVGPQGSQGVQGLTGDDAKKIGPAGRDGQQGKEGTRGDRGERGEKGDTVVNEENLDYMQKDIQALQSALASTDERLGKRLVKEIKKIPTDFVKQSVLEPSIKALVAPELNRVVRSLQSQIYRVSEDVKTGGGGGSPVTSQTPTGTINGTNKDFVHTGTLVAVYLNGAYQTITGDYTVSGSTITFVDAPPTNSVLTVLVQ